MAITSETGMHIYSPFIFSRFTDFTTRNNKIAKTLAKLQIRLTCIEYPQTVVDTDLFLKLPVPCSGLACAQSIRYPAHTEVMISKIRRKYEQIPVIFEELVVISNQIEFPKILSILFTLNSKNPKKSAKFLPENLYNGSKENLGVVSFFSFFKEKKGDFGHFNEYRTQAIQLDDQQTNKEE